MHRPPQHNPAPSTRGNAAQGRRCAGAAFIITLLVVTVLAALVLVFAYSMRTEAMAATNHAAVAEARWAAYGVIEAVRGDLAQDIANGEAPRLSDVPAAGGRVGGTVYWLIGPDPNDDTQHVYGIVGESSKLNLNNATYEMLIEFAGMTENHAAAILDWRDDDTETTPGGAESDYYLTRPTPYNAKDGPFETIGELAMVRGFNTDVLYGEDTNRNGRLDPTEDDGDASGVEDNADGSLSRGIAALTTVYSSEPNTDLTGEARINIQQRSQELGALLNDLVDEDRFAELAGTIDNHRPYENVLDFYIRNELTEAEFEAMHDKLTTSDQGTRVGLVDVYTASADVLNALPGMEPGDGELLVADRPVLAADEPPGSIAWIVDTLGKEKATAVAGRLTHRSTQFTVDVVAVTEDGRGFCRLRVVLDVSPTIGDNATLPEIVYIQDLTGLGWPMDSEVLDQLRAGVTPEEVAQMYSDTLQ
jgi:DNA uptake protein ComE-like DNA-binding protein